MNDKGERIHGLDALRGILLLLGVLFHSILMAVDVVGQSLIRTGAYDVLYGVIYFVHLFRMTLFFLIAGYFMRLSMRYRGQKSFLRDRFVRIAIPLAAAWPILILSSASIDWAFYNPASAPIGSFFPRLSLHVFPLDYLWFLYFLIIYYVAVTAATTIMKTNNRVWDYRSIDRFVTLLVSRPYGGLILATPLIMMFLFWTWQHPWQVIPTPQRNLIPKLTPLVAYAVAFTFGYLLHRQPSLLKTVALHVPNFTALGVLLGIAALLQVGTDPFNVVPLSGINKVLYAIVCASATWYLALAGLGWGVRLFSRPSKAMRYISDTSYWVYLIHVPIALVIAAIFSSYTISVWARVAVLTVLTFLISLLSYELFVKGRLIGRILNQGKIGKVSTP